MRKQIIIGSRGSKLALAQTEHIAHRLRHYRPDVDFRVEEISTKGDRVLDTPLSHIGDKGLFTKELETALLDNTIDLAVHSLKDLPTELPPGLLLGAVPSRANPSDVLVSARWKSLDDLPTGAIVGTSSLRRRAQLLAYRPDLHVMDLRGNIDTRLKRVADGHYDAAILACAGLVRLELGAAITEMFSREIMLPAPGQGALGIEIRADDDDLLELIAPLHDPITHAETCAERTVLEALGGGCQVPLGVHAIAEDDALMLYAGVFSLDGSDAVRVKVEGFTASPAVLGQSAADLLKARGGDAIMREALADAKRPLTPGLTGKTVVVTRAKAQAGEQVHRLEVHGATVVEFPTIQIDPPEEPPHFEQIAEYDWLILTSVNVVHQFFALVEDLGMSPEDLRGPRVCAIGPATIHAAEKAGLTVDIAPDKYASEHLLEVMTAAEESLQGKRILIPRSDIAHSYLPKELTKLGAEVSEVVVYRTQMPEVSKRQIMELTELAPDYLTFTSPSTIKNFVAILGQKNVDLLMRHSKLAVIGPVTHKAAVDLGLDVHIEPKQHDVPGLVQAILEHARAH